MAKLLFWKARLAERRRVRREAGKLRDLIITSRTLNRYNAALARFFNWAKNLDRTKADIVSSKRGFTRKPKDLVKFGNRNVELLRVGTPRLGSWGSNPEEFDILVSEFIEELWVSGEPKSWANDTCSGLQHHVPNLRGKLVGSWRLLKAWSKTELPNRATPMSLEVLQAFIGIALKEHDLNHALCYALCFQGLLRPAEAFQLVPQTVDLNLQARLAAPF